MRTRRLAILLAALGALVILLWLMFGGGKLAPPQAGSEDPGGAPPPISAGTDAALPVAPTPSALPIRVAAPRGPEDAAPASFEGRVVSTAGGGPVPGSELTFSRAGAAASVRAGPDGGFAFQPPEPGRWLLQAVTAPGYLPFAPEWGHSPVELDARPGLHVRGLEIHLAPAVELLGRVVDDDGAPVAGAAVRILGAVSEAALVTIADRFVSDARGEFRFSAPEGALLEARKDGYRPGRAELDWNAAVNRRVTLELSPAGRSFPPAAPIAGRVVERGGRPVAGALVTAARMRFGGEGAASAQAVTGADGAFALADLEMGRYQVSARAEGRAPGSVSRVAPGAKDVLIELGPGGRLRGCVRDAASGAPVAPFTVLVYEKPGPIERSLQRSRSVIDPSGCYALDDLSPGPAAVVVSAPGYGASRERQVDVPEAGEAVADAVLTRGGSVSGQVVDDTDGAPIAGARIAVEGALEGAASTFPVLSEAVTGDDGRFVVAGLPARASLFVAAAGHHARILGGLDVPPGATVGPFELRLRRVAEGEEPQVDLAGIGVQLSARGEGAVVANVVPGGGGADAGLRRGDLIVTVDGRSVVDLGFQDTVNAIRGPEGSTVVLGLRRGEERLELRVVRRLVRG
jgi:protocatechuate 3,4-dioxygenase beta subunit